MQRVIGIMAVVVLLAGCGSGDFAIGPGAADFEAKLCKDYHLYRTSASEVYVAPEGGDRAIPAEVVELGYDQRFIIAKQSYLTHPPRNNPYREPDPVVFNYWILDVTVPQTYGPLTEDNFRRKRKELGVPHDLTMKDVDSYRH